MKKTEMDRRVLKILRDWDGCQKTMETAREIIDMMVGEGMEPPFSSELTTGDGCKGIYPRGNEWDPETKKKRKKKNSKQTKLEFYPTTTEFD
jgi:hypothetical protein